MPTNTLGGQSRAQHTQVVNTMRFTVNYNDGNKLRGKIPQGAFITACHVEIVTTFDGTSPDVIIGSASGGSQLVAAADVNAGSAAVTAVTRPLGRSLTASGDLEVWSGNAATDSAQGSAVVVIQYEGNKG